jgi:hypothetical protein
MTVDYDDDFFDQLQKVVATANLKLETFNLKLFPYGNPRNSHQRPFDN